MRFLIPLGMTNGGGSLRGEAEAISMLSNIDGETETDLCGLRKDLKSPGD